MEHQLGIIGYGGMAQWHAFNINKSLGGTVRIAGVSDIRAERRDAARADGLRVYESNEALLADPAVEIVLIATPNDGHLPLARQAFAAGKHVICEKPAALSTAQFDEMIAASERAGKLLTVHQNRRWDSDFLKVKEVVEKQPLGRVYMLESRVQGSRQVLNGWRGAAVNGGGMVYDWGVHLIDQVLQMIPESVAEVYAQLFSVHCAEVDDNFKALLRFESGVSALIEVSMNCFITHPRWHVCGENGTLVIEDWDCRGRMVRLSDKEELKWDEVIVYTAAGPTRSMAPRPVETMEELPLPAVTGDSFRSFYGNVARALEGQEELAVKPAETRRVMRVIDAIFESGRTGACVKGPI